jgi:sigma-B regulation protein RsbU (phosphoserine phosphatase)
MVDSQFYAGLPSDASAPGDRLALLYQLSQTFSSSLDLDEVLNRVMDEVIVVTRAERGFVMLKAETGELVFHVARGIDQSSVEEPGFQISLSIVEDVAERGQAVLTSDAQVDPRWNMRQSVRLLGLRSILCVPLKLQERVLGTIYVDNRIQAGIFSKDDQELLTAIASSAAVAIENARLYKVAVEKGRLERELQMARQVQIDLIPRETPQVPGWEFATRWLPARQVAGDFFDFIYTRNGKIGMLVADVSDKGMPAALFMALSRSTVRASLDASSSPGEGMYRANCLIQADSPSSMFVTLVYAQLDPEKGEIRYVNAGHNPPLLFQKGKHKGQGSLRRLNRTGMAMGVLSDERYEEIALVLQPGDFVVFYTDGITDALNDQGQDFGIDNLESLVLEQRENSANQIAAALEDSLRTHIGEQPLFDDITLVIARRID